MHYYKRNIGDYHKKAGRLSILEHGAYTLLMDACYDRERFPTKDEAIDWLWARGEDEIKAIEFVLEKFFELQDDGTYVQNRIKEELSAYHAMAETNQRIAREREAKRREARNKKKSGGVNNDVEARSVHEACETVNETPPNQEPLTINEEPLTKNEQPISDSVVFEEIYNDLKAQLQISGILPVGKRVNNDLLKPDIYSYLSWCDSKKMTSSEKIKSVVGFFKKKDLEDRKRYYTFESESNRSYHTGNEKPKAPKVSDERAAEIRAQFMGGLGL